MKRGTADNKHWQNSSCFIIGESTHLLVLRLKVLQQENLLKILIIISIPSFDRRNVVAAIYVV